MEIIKMNIEELKKTFESSKMKKISLNINEKTLEMIYDMCKVYGLDRTKMIAGIIMSGIKGQTNFTEKTWNNFIKDKEYKDKKKLIEGKLKELESFKKKWYIDTIPS